MLTPTMGAGPAATLRAVDHGGGGLDQHLQLTAVLGRGKDGEPGQVQHDLGRAAGSVVYQLGPPDDPLV